MDLFIPNYAGTTFEKQCTSTSSEIYGTSGNNAEVTIFTVGWRNANAIYQIDLFPTNGANFPIGCMFSLYGIL